MMTGSGDPDLPRILRARGAYDFIAKPFNMARLRSVVWAALAFWH
jgi:FixJ family two-component response regulator